MMGGQDHLASATGRNIVSINQDALLYHHRRLLFIQHAQLFGEYRRRRPAARCCGYRSTTATRVSSSAASLSPWLLRSREITPVLEEQIQTWRVDPRQTVHSLEHVSALRRVGT